MSKSNTNTNKSEDKEPINEITKARTQEDAAAMSSASPGTGVDVQGREDYFMDIDRMVNEGLGGGNVTMSNGHIGESTTDTMTYPESVLNHKEEKS
ncbi:hypothetical protein OB236_35210 [Paenibacillus sp. WQ 127069]|uniref:DUF4025 domain-containing protein n=1 Tax=Paenibacillus baimaensis TaxID=2982185 RepID=A0ABT2UTH5_9BACL|nr:hypothetical protein [Paenibacillus sp. WQ 127069]MCU6797391.1 hypothetical protein [Paenibacillus sp. WQ 127069]